MTQRNSADQPIVAARGQAALNEFARLVDEMNAEDGSTDGCYEDKLP